MKILFICKGNVGRSQMAMEFLNKSSKNHKSVSAGITVGEHEKEHLHELVIKSMSKLGYDLSKNTRKQLNPQMVKEADKIIIITENKDLPSYIDMTKSTFWNVGDAKGKSLEFHNKMRDEIKKLVGGLIKEIE